MAQPTHSIFIGYRRDDTADASGRVYDRLWSAFGDGQVFKDVDNLPVGVDFGEHILTILPRCRVFLAMIGPGWVDIRNDAGARRLDDPSDWVRIELEAALATPGLQIIPVLMNGAPMPREDQLPESLRRLVKLNAAFVRRDPDFHKDMDKLIDALRVGLATGRVEVEAPTQQVLSGSAAAWKLVENSLDPNDYADFLEAFRGTTEAMVAAKHKRQLEAWSQVKRDDPDAIAAFLAASPFITLADHARDAQQTIVKARQNALEKVQAERRAREAAEAEARRQAEARRKSEDAERVARLEKAARTARHEEERRMGLAVVRAREAASAGRPVPERTFLINLPGVASWPNPQMVAIPSGRFWMGAAMGEVGASDDEFPPREVRIDYVMAMGQHAVTFAEWDAALSAGAKLEAPSSEGWGRANRPVINVSWDDVQAYLEWLNERAELADQPDAYRLPSEAEWEYACRAGTTTPFSFGETISTAQANYDGSDVYGAGKEGEYRQKTVPVGSFAANAFGLHEMHGNVWEWCEDTFLPNYRFAPQDGSAEMGLDASSLVLRGGSWANLPRYLRSAARSRGERDDQLRYNGFRLARTLSA